jgi:hypothetical protein
VIKYLKLPFFFDADKIAAEINMLGKADWLPHYQKLQYEGEWTAIPLRSMDGKTDNIYISPFKDPEYADIVYLSQCPYIKTVLSAFKFPLQAVRLLKLNAGAIIKPHRDAGLQFEQGEIRIHIPVITHDEVEFYLDNERIFPKPGECWYMNFNLLHHINNKSKTNRTHLVIDGLVNDWVKDIFESPDIKVKKEIPDTANTNDENTKRSMIIHLRELNTTTSIKMAENLEKEISAPGLSE